MPTPLINPYADLLATLLATPTSPEQLQVLRKKLIWAYSWAVPSSELIETVARYSPILELGAGTGYWGWLLKQAGAEVICVDAQISAPPRWFPVLEGSPQLLAQDPGLANRTLLMVWPPLDNPMAEQALECFRGDTIIYAGEWRGRTGTDRFHEQLETRFQKTLEMPLPRWPGFHDSLYIFQRGELTPRKHSPATPA